MLTIFVPAAEQLPVQQLIDAEYRLNEIVFVRDPAQAGEEQTARHLIVNDNEIRLPIDWANEAPPYLLAYPLALTPDNLLAVVYTLLNNYEKAYEKAERNPALLRDIDCLNCIQHGVAVGFPQEPEQFDTPFEEYRFLHNAAVLGHYGELTRFVHYSVIRHYYERAFVLAPNDEWRAFTGKHLATLLLDADELTEAAALLNDCIRFAISEDALYELKNVQYGVWMKQLAAPYDPQLLVRIKETLWEVLQYYERQQRSVQVALLLIDAAQMANYSDSFSEALGYVNRAIQLLEEEGIPELTGNAQYRKGTLLYTWAQNGNPQFYRAAMEAYQQALKVFTKENAPEAFAEIHHHLGVIYSEIPDEVKKKSVWAAVSMSSFREALTYYTRETHPYEYARICTSFANALTRFPEARLSDNYTRALSYYDEALEIRTAAEYPYERVLTILNFLEAAWFVSVPEAGQQQALFTRMTQLAGEVPALVNDPGLIAEAGKHLAMLNQLKNDLVISAL